jgi:hypothetical protein
LLIHYLNQSKAKGVFPIYILADEYKKLAFPDLLIRLLIQITEDLYKALPVKQRWFKRNNPLRQSISSLRDLLESPCDASVTEDIANKTKEGMEAEVGYKKIAKAKARHEKENSFGRSSQFKESKLDLLERQLHDHKTAIEYALSKINSKRACVLLDDFYLLSRDWQPDVIDYLHRLARDTDLYLKVATIRHRTTLARNHPQTIGVELYQDVEEINLDRMLDDVDSTQGYLAQMLNTLGIECNLESITDTHFNPDALLSLTLASGGVPRDFLNIFANSVEAAIAENSTRWLTPKWVWKGAGRLTYQTKLKNLRDDASDLTQGLELAFVDLIRFCLQEKKKTAFLISQDEARGNPKAHEVIQQLMDMKLIHVIEPDTSASSSRQGRYEAYTLDFSLFMEPRKRGIQIVEFWIRGEDSHKKGIREAPIYPLTRIEAVLSTGETANPEDVLDAIENELTPTAVQGQQDLFEITK